MLIYNTDMDKISEVLNNFKDDNGCFFTSSGQRHVEHTSILNLFRASDLALPGEKIMDEARLFSSQYLRESLNNTKNILCNEKIAKEVCNIIIFANFAFQINCIRFHHIIIYQLEL